MQRKNNFLLIIQPIIAQCATKIAELRDDWLKDEKKIEFLSYDYMTADVIGLSYFIILVV